MSATSRSTARSSSGALYGTGETHLHPPNPCLPDPEPCPPEPPIPTPTPTTTPTPTPEPTTGRRRPSRPPRRRPSRRQHRRPSRRRHTDARADDDTHARAHEHAGADHHPDPDAGTARAEPAAPAGDGQQRLGAGLQRRREDLQEGHDAEGPRAREGPPARRREGEVPHPGDEHGDRRGAQRSRVRSAAEAVQADQGVGEGDLPQRPPVRPAAAAQGPAPGFHHGSDREDRERHGDQRRRGHAPATAADAATPPACACCRRERWAAGSPASARPRGGGDARGRGGRRVGGACPRRATCRCRRPPLRAHPRARLDRGPRGADARVAPPAAPRARRGCSRRSGGGPAARSACSC